MDTCPPQYTAIFDRNKRVHTLMVLCDGAFSSSDLLWLRMRPAIFPLPRPLQTGQVPP